MGWERITGFEYYYSRKIIHKIAKKGLDHSENNNVQQENWLLTVSFYLTEILYSLLLFIESWIPGFMFDGVALKLGANKPSYSVKLLMLLCTVLDAVLILPRLFIKLSLLVLIRFLGFISACIEAVGSFLLPSKLLGISGKLQLVLNVIFSPVLLLKSATNLVWLSFCEVGNHILCLGLGLYDVTVAQLFRQVYADSWAACIFDVYVPTLLENNAMDKFHVREVNAKERFLGYGDEVPDFSRSQEDDSDFEDYDNPDGDLENEYLDFEDLDDLDDDIEDEYSDGNGRNFSL